MTIAEALERVKRDRPGEATDAELRKWLREIEVRWRQEVIDTHLPTRAEAEAKPELTALQLRGQDVFFVPPIEDPFTGETVDVYPVAEMDAFDPAQREYIGAVHTTSATAKSELYYVCAPGTKVTSLEVTHGGGDTVVSRSDGKTWVNWGVDNAGEDFVLVVLTLYLEHENGETDSYTVSIQRYYDGAAATPGPEQDDYEYPELVAMTEASTSLLIPPPDDEVYIYWLYAHIDMRLGELDRYNNDAVMYNNEWLQAAKRYNRSHMPKGRQLRHVVYGSLPVPRGPEDPLDQRRDWLGWR